MPSATPEISIGVPVYNGERFIGALLDSLLAQTFQNFEIVISDNASDDQTQFICEEYARRDDRVRYHRNSQNLGAHPNFNKVFELSRAPFFHWAPCDDLFMPTYLEHCLSALKAAPDVVLAYTDGFCIDEEGKTLLESEGAYVDPASGYSMRMDPLHVAEQSSPFQRYIEISFRYHTNLAVLGLIRSDALRRTTMLNSFYGADKLLLGELALIGRFMSVPEKLFVKRCHREMSAHLSKTKLKCFVDTGSAGILSARTSQLLGFLVAPLGKPIGIMTKLACWAAVPLFGVKAFYSSICGAERERRRWSKIMRARKKSC